MKIYTGKRINGRVFVTVTEGDKTTILSCFYYGAAYVEHKGYKTLNFDWGCECFKSYHLSTSILKDFLGDYRRADSLADDFLINIISKLNKEKDWVLTSEDIKEALKDCHEHVPTSWEDTVLKEFK